MKPIQLYALLCLFLFPFSGFSQIRLPKLVSDGLVLQRDTEVKLWGWSSPNEKIVLTFKNKKYRTTADAKGNWTVLLDPQPAGGPFQLSFKGKNEVTVQDVLFGDVWICAGQSNMVLPIERVKEKYPEEVANDHYPEIRHFFIPTTTNLQGPQQDLAGSTWKSAVDQDLLTFSAAAYFFAKAIYQKYEVPIGLVNASVGGTPIESWISEEGFRGFPKILETIQKNKDENYTRQFTTRPKYLAPPLRDKGLTAPIKWYEPDYEPKGWHNFYIPGFWEDQGVKNLNGVVWFRRVIEVPAAMIGSEAKLFMGRIIDADEVYVNGKKVGNITYQYPPRRYTVPAGLLKAGKNIITVRVTNYGGKGGFVPDKNYSLNANGMTIDLKGEWQYKVGEVFVPQPPSGETFDQFWSQNQPTSLYNAMVAPFTNMAIKGFLWYQGESNLSNPKPYKDFLPALIRDWREQFGRGEQPFLFVQLANYGDVDYLPTESGWAELREAQRLALSVPNTAMASAIDLGEWNDIHPLDKEGVGTRLALGAMKLAYDEDLVYSGPLVVSAKQDQQQVILSFSSIGGGLVAIDGEPLSRFEVAGENRHFVRASAKIVGNTVVVSSEAVSDPKYVRYAWADNPRGANLYNKEGLPASSFQIRVE